MTGDLISLRVLMVSALQPVRDLWRRGAGLASVPVEFFEAGPADATAQFAKGGIDVVLLDAALPSADLDAVIQHAGALQPRPYVATCGGAGKRQGADAALPQPADADEARTLFERCVRARLPIRALVVDDSGTMRSIVRKILSASRYTFEVSEAEEGIAALKELSSGGFDLALIDYNMPGFNGFETLAEIKRVAPHVAVIIMTSTADDAMVEKAMAKGAIGFMKKPFYPADIDVVLERYFSKPR